MDNRTRTALLGSIAKWQGIVKGEIEDQGSRNCPLCKEFLYTETPVFQCVGCPIFDRTGHRFCNYSTYRDFNDANENNEPWETLQPLAQAELQFLISLLPPGDAALEGLLSAPTGPSR